MTASVSEPNVTWATPAHGQCATHRPYRLSCGQLDELIERSGNCCEICRGEAAGSAWGVLHIDHDPGVGKWAVRGLLCSACNVRLRADRKMPRTPQIEGYLQRAWYLGELRRRGVSAEKWAEPGLGSTIVVDGTSWMRTGERRWEGHRRNHAALTSWDELWRDFGPLRICNVSVRTEIPEWAYRSRMCSFLRDERRARSARLTREQLSMRADAALAAARTAIWSGHSCEGLDRVIAALDRQGD